MTSFFANKNLVELPKGNEQIARVLGELITKGCPATYFLDLTNRWEEWGEFLEWLGARHSDGPGDDPCWPPQNIILLGRASTQDELVSIGCQFGVQRFVEGVSWGHALLLRPTQVLELPGWKNWVEQIIVEPPQCEYCDDPTDRDWETILTNSS